MSGLLARKEEPYNERTFEAAMARGIVLGLVQPPGTGRGGKLSDQIFTTVFIVVRILSLFVPYYGG